MKVKITYLKTGWVVVAEVKEIYYTSEKLVLIKENGCFESFFHGDPVVIETIKELDETRKTV